MAGLPQRVRQQLAVGLEAALLGEIPDEIEPIAAEAPWLKYVTSISRPWEDKAWKGEVGRVDDLVRKYSDMWGLAPENTSVYLCGHPKMVETCKAILGRRGWQKDSMREEVYFVPAKPA